MNGMVSVWACILLYSAWCVVFGISGLILAGTHSERSRSIGQVSQGILLTFVVGSACYRESMPIASGVGSAVVLGVLVIHALLNPSAKSDKLVLNQDEST